MLEMLYCDCNVVLSFRVSREAINALRNSKEVRSRAEAIVYLNVLIEFGLVRY